MDNIMKITPDITRITVPYEDIYTTVFVIRTPEGAVLFDTASYDSDVPEYILPALDALGVQDLKYIVISHNHGDHSGGLNKLAIHFPEAKIVSLHPSIAKQYGNCVLSPKDGEKLLNVLSVITIPGHAADAIALLDTRTGTLLSGDSLQVYGIYGSGKWGANIHLPVEHLVALKKLHTLPIKTILASHDYQPYGYLAQGEDAVAAYINGCKQALIDITSFMCSHPDLDDIALESAYIAETGLPAVGSHVFAAMRTVADSGVL